MLRGCFSVTTLPKSMIWRAECIQKLQQLAAWLFFSYNSAQIYDLARRVYTETAAACCVAVFQF
ncbi:MAG: hypothetical protein ACTTJ2_07535, partial [Anaerovoracaceae bacterium]